MLMMSKDDNLLLQMGGLISSLIDARFLTPELKAQVPELFTLMASDGTSTQKLPVRQNGGAMTTGGITNKSELLSLFFEVITAEMPFRNFTLRLYTRMLQVNDNLANGGSILLSPAQQDQLRAVYLSSVHALKKLSLKIYDHVHKIEKHRPELRIYENLVSEIGNFVPPEDCLKAEFHRLLSHPAVTLRMIPDAAFERGAGRSLLPSQL